MFALKMKIFFMDSLRIFKFMFAEVLGTFGISIRHGSVANFLLLTEDVVDRNICPLPG
jgi:hypothetical protein